MEFFIDRKPIIALVVLSVLTLLGGFEYEGREGIEKFLWLATGIMFTAINVYFMKYVSNGERVSGKPPYQAVMFNTWSYIWRLGVIALLYPFLLVPFLLFVPESLKLGVGMLLALVGNSLLIFVLFCRNKREKIEEMKSLIAGIGF